MGVGATWVTDAPEGCVCWIGSPFASVMIGCDSDGYSNSREQGTSDHGGQGKFGEVCFHSGFILADL